ncbi:MAG: 3-isopropylmalate dehydratase small subunit, partial [Clostridiales bacterium]
PIAIKAAGISCVIAADFARIFYRNALNIGLPIAECREASLDIADGEEIEIDFAQGIIKNISKNCQYEIKPFPAFMEELIAQGGLLAYTKQKLAEK